MESPSASNTSKPPTIKDEFDITLAAGAELEPGISLTTAWINEPSTILKLLSNVLRIKRKSK